MKTIFYTFDNLIDPLRTLASKVVSPLYDLGARLYLAYVFGLSGLARWESYQNGSWDDQIFLFAEEHPVPNVPAEIAAPLTTGAELLLPLLLILGLFGRFAAAGLLVMALTIELTYQAHPQHWLWMALAASILIKGPGPIAADNLLLRWIRN